MRKVYINILYLGFRAAIPSVVGISLSVAPLPKYNGGVGILCTGDDGHLSHSVAPSSCSDDTNELQQGPRSADLRHLSEGVLPPNSLQARINANIQHS